MLSRKAAAKRQKKIVRPPLLRKAEEKRWKRILWHFPPRKIAEQRHNRFVKPFLPQLKKLAQSIAGERTHLVDDLVSEATIQIIKKCPAYKPPKPIFPFVYTIALNKMKDVMRHESRYEKLIVSQTELKQRELPKQIAPREMPTKKQILRSVSTRLRKIDASPAQKERFAYYIGLRNGKVKSYKGVARHFTIPIGTVKSGIAKIRKKLKEKVPKLELH